MCWYQSKLHIAHCIKLFRDLCPHLSKQGKCSVRPSSEGSLPFWKNLRGRQASHGRLQDVLWGPAQVLQLEMERLSLSKAAANDKAASGRLKGLDKQLLTLKAEQKELTGQWQVCGQHTCDTLVIFP